MGGDVAAQVVKGKHPFERVEMSKDEALEMFKYNDFKIDVLKRKGSVFLLVTCAKPCRRRFLMAPCALLTAVVT